YNVGQIGQQVHGGAPVEPVRGPNTSHGHEALPHHAGPLGSQHRERQRIGGNDGCSGLGGISNYSPNWWRNWSSTALARRKGTCDDVQLGSWKREGIQSRRMNLCWLRLGQAEHALYDANVCRELKPDWSKRCCFREGVALCFLQRYVEAANAFLRRSKAKRSVMSSEVVDAQKKVS
ncbi:hypothetical protein HID58_077713, partial [Brassica napus]